MADSIVRTAWAGDAPAIGRVQLRAWTTGAQAVPAIAVSAADAAFFAEGWHHAITRPPTARHRVLVAVTGAGTGPGDAAGHGPAGSGGTVVGYAATAPCEDPDAHPGSDGEVVAFHVDPALTRSGHGSRLLTACADTLRADGFRRAVVWLPARDDVQRRFFEGAGWAPDGAHRELVADDDDAEPAPAEHLPDAQSPRGLRQVRLHTDLTPEVSADLTTDPDRTTRA